MGFQFSPLVHTGKRILSLAFWLILLAFTLNRSEIPYTDEIERVRAYTRSIEFDFVTWTINALSLKVSQASLGTANYLPDAERKQIALDYLDLIAQVQDTEGKLFNVYSDPKVEDKQVEAAPIRKKLDDLYRQRDLLGPLAEAVIQSQVSHITDDFGLSFGGQPIPPVLYHITPLPLALIVSPRNAIQQDADISLIPDLTVDQRAVLEEKVDKALNVSSLVVPVGGVGLYPTMVYQTTDIVWLTETVSHEWTHNFLTLRPLGVSYENSPELRTMNETTADIAGKELGLALLKRYYPEHVPQPAPPPSTGQSSQGKPSTPVFDFNVEMHLTRITVDKLLSEGKIDQAETYMEQRRQFLWDHGYHIRKLNQAYFAFYGAYASQPIGAAGEDPVGAAVRKLRLESPTLADFLNRMSWMSSFDQLKETVSGNHP